MNTQSAAAPLAIGALPLSVEDLSAMWLKNALSACGRSPDVTGVSVSKVIPGTATKVLVEVEYADHDPAGPPAMLCIKGGFEERMRNFAPGNIYALESVFYAQVLPHVRAAAPRCWFAGIDDENSHGIVILDDVAAAGAQFGEPVRAFTVDEVASGLEAQAAWHGRSFGWTAEQMPAVPVGSRVVRDAAKVLLSPEYWEQHYAED